LPAVADEEWLVEVFVTAAPGQLPREQDHERFMAAVPEVEAMASERFHYWLRLTAPDPVEARRLAREMVEEFFAPPDYEVAFGSAPGRE
jgi:hypothetical protein